MSTRKPRSIEQHRRFFAVIAETFRHWPEAHPFQPDSTEHLRAWLLVKAKHCVIQTYHMTEDTSEVAKLLPVIMATMARKHCWCRAAGTELHVCVPQSIAFEAVSHGEFQAINDAVDEIVRLETGLDPDRLLQEKDKAA